MGTKKKITRRDFLKTTGGAVAGGAALSMGFGIARAKPAEVKLGVIYPLSGPSAYAGKLSRDAVDLCVDYVNNKWPKLPIPIGKWEGIPGLNGAKIKLIHADHRGEPDRGADLAKKLIFDEKVVGLVGCYHSSVTKTVSTVAEKNKIPMINPESTSPALTKRGYQWFFRATPHDRIFLRDIFDFLDLLQQGKVPGVGAVAKADLDAIGACTENTEWGAGSRDVIKEYAGKKGYKVVADIPYSHESPDLTAEVRKLLAAKPEVLLFVSYISDALLLTKTMKEFKAKANIFWAQNAGFVQPKYVETIGPATEGIMTRSVFSPKLFAVKPVAKNLNDEFNKRTGKDFSGINEAGSTDPEAIRKTANKIEIPGKDLIVPWKGIKFEDVAGETNQNTWSSGLIVQYQNKEQEIVYPLDVATKKLIYPWPGFK
jgi:branched-chain amino acid transport system substrate-binding protein